MMSKRLQTENIVLKEENIRLRNHISKIRGKRSGVLGLAETDASAKDYKQRLDESKLESLTLLRQTQVETMRRGSLNCKEESCLQISGYKGTH
ncbi:hypothetical protein DPMN_001893 [Dreissena polymorpha]|uniref:Uncharacterized protein n=1 Tax=Dreissena polymorpha TaxID=45954 RepID=A0A9D4MJ76_DREPO|nr:hypothetical protein DPMN_001893 [Dreissena polymorpha]